MSLLINTAEVTAQLVAQLEQHPDIAGFFKNVERGEYYNTDPARTPWCGVYRTGIDYAPKVLGHHSRSWQALLKIRLIVQAHAGTGPAAEDACEDAVQRVLTAVLGDLTVHTTMEMLKSVAIEYSYDPTESKTIDFQWAFIDLVYETRTGI
jgi:hypothetical protein